MKKPLLLICVIFLNLCNLCFAQITFQKTFGGASNDRGYSVQQTTDDGYIITGYTNSFGAGLNDVYLIKTNANGNTLWTKTYGETDDDMGLSVQQTVDGGYIISGETRSFGAGGSDVYLIKTDSIGGTLWSKTYGGAGNEEFSSVRQTADGGYIIAAKTQSFGAGSTAVYLVKTDANGDTLWTKTFGGSGTDGGRSVQQTVDGGYIITGHTTSFGGATDVYLVKTDSTGNQMWSKNFGGAGADEGWSVQQTADGGYIITGYSDNGSASNVYLVKTDVSGNTLWSRTYGGTFQDIGTSVQQTADGGYIITGRTQSFGAGGADVYLIKTDANGDTLWTKAFGGTNEDGGQAVQQIADGGYIIAGYTNNFGAGFYDVYFIKTDSLGNSGGCNEYGASTTVVNPSTVANSAATVTGFGATVTNPPTIINSTATVDIVLCSFTPPPIANFTASSTTICPGACIIFIDLSTNTPTSWLWSFSGGTPSTSTSQNPTNICYNTPGNYDVTLIVTNADGTDTLTQISYITVSQILTSISSTPVSCYGGSNGTATVTPSGGTTPYTFSWSPGGQATNFIINQPAGTYTVTVTDSNGCTAVDSITLAQPASPLTFTITSTPDTGGCTGTATANPSGGTPAYNYWWDGVLGSQTKTGLCADSTYTVIVWDNNSCTDTAGVTISGPACSLTTTITGIDATCNGGNDGSATASASGGTPPYSYLWNTSPFQTGSTASGLEAGTYYVIIADAAGCSDTNSITISEPPAINIVVSSKTDATCGVADGSATVSVTGGTPPYSYSWSSGDTLAFADSLASGIYMVLVTDTLGCSKFRPIMINDIGGPSITGDTVAPVTCNGGSDGAIFINVSGGSPPYTYQWSNGSAAQGISNLVAGPYEVLITDANGCVAMGSIEVTQPEALALLITTADASCGGADGAANVSVSGGVGSYTYNWSSGGANASETGLTAGMYVVTVTDSNGCTDSAAAAVSEAGGAVIVVDSILDASCNGDGGSIYISVTGGTEPYTYLWSNSAATQDLIGVPAGNYDVMVTSAGGCIAMASAVIEGQLHAIVPICLVTVDSASNSNLIVWQKPEIQGIKSYNIYKESTQADVYYLIGNVPVDTLSQFIDTLSNPLQQAWRYKISVVDSCDNESELSESHKTIHLTINLGIGNTINLIWDHYDGFDFLTYYIERYTTSTGWVEYDSIQSNLTSRTDFSPPSGNLYYRIVAKHTDVCTASKKAADYNSSRSNTQTSVIPLGISEFKVSGLEFQVYPNPSRGVFTIEINHPVTQSPNHLITIYDVLGQEILKSSIVNLPAGRQGRKSKIDLSNNPAGIYHLQVITDKGIGNKKIIIQ